MLTASEILNQSLNFYKKNLKLLAGYSAWLLLPYAAMVLISLLAFDNPLLNSLIIICNITQAIIYLWLAVFIPLLIQRLNKKDGLNNIDFLQQKAWSVLPSILFVALLEALVILGGMILLIIPGFIFWVWFSLSQMAAILDEKRGRAALVFSREIVRGKFWPVLWRLIYGPLIIAFSALIFSSLLIIIVSLITNSSLNTILGETPPLWADIITTVVETFALPIVITYMTTFYLDLKSKIV